MARYLCSCCHEVVESASMRVAFCASCGTPVTTEDLLPVQPAIAGRQQGTGRAVHWEEPQRFAAQLAAFALTQGGRAGQGHASRGATVAP